MRIYKKNSLLVINIIIFIVSIGCKSIPEQKPEYEQNISFYKIKNRFIDSSLPDTIALIHGEVNLISFDQDTMECGGEIIINRKIFKLYNDGEKYSIRLPCEKTDLLFHDACDLRFYYYPDTLFLKQQENIELDIILYQRKTGTPTFLKLKEKK